MFRRTSLLEKIIPDIGEMLRGRLSLWLAEVRAGVYVGVYNRRVRERIWDEVKVMIGPGNAVITWSAPTDSGFEFEAVGENRREPEDFDGPTLVKFKLRIGAAPGFEEGSASAD
jgi:CRISPR-associated protein Cas2